MSKHKEAVHRRSFVMDDYLIPSSNLDNKCHEIFFQLFLESNCDELYACCFKWTMYCYWNFGHSLQFISFCKWRNIGTIRVKSLRFSLDFTWPKYWISVFGQWILLLGFLSQPLFSFIALTSYLQRKESNIWLISWLPKIENHFHNSIIYPILIFIY